MKNTKIGMRTFFLSIIFFSSIIFSPLKAVDTASLLPNAVQQFFDNNGNPLSSGKVYTYDAGTSTLRTTWKDSAESIPNTNPIVLDAGGKAIIYGSGTYRQVVKDRNGNLIWDAVTAPGGGGSSPSLVGDGNLVGTVLPWSGLIAPNQYLFAYGEEIARASFPEFFIATTQQLNVICSSASNTLTGVADTSQVKIGSAIELPLCVIAGTTVIGKSASTIILSNPSSVSINSVATFFPWGNGNGTTTFNVPDFRGVVLAGRTNMGGTASTNLTVVGCPAISPDSLGALCGNQTHTLTISEMAMHNHAISDPGHAHAQNDQTVITTPGGATAPGGAAAADRGGLTHTATTGITQTNVQGSSVPFPLIQPTITINYIVKVTPDTSTSVATGVWSIGGMTGVISCGSGILCTGNNISAGFGSGTSGGIPFYSSAIQISSSNLLVANQIIIGGGAGNAPSTITCSTVTTVMHGGLPPTCGQIVSADITTNTITTSNLAQANAATIFGNPTASTANIQGFTVQGLSNLAAPSATLDFVPIFDHLTGTIKHATTTAMLGSTVAGVASVNALAGILSLNVSSGLNITSGGTTIAISPDIATTANFEAGTANKLLDANVVFSPEVTTTFGATTSFDFNTFINTKVTLTGNTALTCSNMKAGQAGTISFIQDSTGTRVITPATAAGWCSQFRFPAATIPTLTTSASAVDILAYSCRSSTYCAASLNKGFNP